MEYEDQSVSQFNMSLATLQRIDAILNQLRVWQGMREILMIDRYLLALYKELHPFLNEKEREELAESKKDMIIWKVEKAYDHDEMVIDRVDSLKNMDNYELRLRELLHDKGLLMAKPDDPHIALE